MTTNQKYATTAQQIQEFGESSLQSHIVCTKFGPFFHIGGKPITTTSSPQPLNCTYKGKGNKKNQR